MKKFISGYLHFSRQEINGLILLLVAIALVWIVPSVLKSKFHEKSFVVHSHSQRRADSSDTAPQNISNPSGFSAVNKNDQNHWKTSALNYAPKTIELHDFDPNSLDAKGWKQFGISEHVVHAIVTYRSKGGVFHAPSDLKKIYGLNESDFNRLEPFIVIADSFNKKTSVRKEAEKIVSAVELNGADSLQLVALPGIGPVLAERIIHFRNNLGGFYSADQLKEVYGLAPETFNLIKDKVSVDSVKIEKIDINHISKSDLQKHLYFRNPAAGAIISYRDEHGDYHSIADLNRIEILSSGQISQMQHYLVFKDSQ